jgi:hypothetical protein
MTQYKLSCQGALVGVVLYWTIIKRSLKIKKISNKWIQDAWKFVRVTH